MLKRANVLTTKPNQKKMKSAPVIRPLHCIISTSYVELCKWVLQTYNSVTKPFCDVPVDSRFIIYPKSSVGKACTKWCCSERNYMCVYWGTKFSCLYKAHDVVCANIHTRSLTACIFVYNGKRGHQMNKRFRFGFFLLENELVCHNFILSISFMNGTDFLRFAFFLTFPAYFRLCSSILSLLPFSLFNCSSLKENALSSSLHIAQALSLSFSLSVPHSIRMFFFSIFE